MNPTGTLILTRQDIVRVLPLADCIAAVEVAFSRLSASSMLLPGVVHIGMPEGGFHIKSAAYAGNPDFVAVKVNGNFPGNAAKNGLPTIQGALLLADGRNGSLLAIMDSAEITALRTAAATAVAAKYLAPEGARTATIIGCGIQGKVQLRALTEVLPLETVYACDAEPGRARDFARELGKATSCNIVPVEQFATGTLQSQVIVTCTPSRNAFLRAEHVAPGTFVAAVGADHHDKLEIDPMLMANAVVVVDVLEQASLIGDLHRALAVGAMKREDVFAELGSVVNGMKKRTDIGPRDIVVFDSTGCAIQDVAAAGFAYERASSQNIGLAVSLA